MIGVFSKLVLHFRLFVILLIAFLFFQLLSQNISADNSVLIITPHPDDEVLSTGGHIARFVKQGDQVYVAALTAGEGFTFDIYLKNKTITPNFNNFLKYGEKRINELTQSLKILGVKKNNVFVLGFPDGGLDFLWLTHWKETFKSQITSKTYTFYENSFLPNTPFKGENIKLQLQQIIKSIHPTKIFIVDTLDIHNDHWPTYCFAMIVILDIMTKNNNFCPEIYTYPIHFQKYPNSKGYKKDKKLTPTIEMKRYNSTYQEYPINHNEMLLKEKAIRNYKSQFFLIKKLLVSFIRKNEVFGQPIKYQLDDFKNYELDDSSIDVSSHYRNTSANIKNVTIRRDKNYLNFTLNTEGRINKNYNYFLRLNIFFDDRFERHDISYHDKESIINIIENEKSINFELSLEHLESARYLFFGMDTNSYPKVRKARAFIDRTNYYILEL